MFQTKFCDFVLRLEESKGENMKKSKISFVTFFLLNFAILFSIIILQFSNSNLPVSHASDENSNFDIEFSDDFAYQQFSNNSKFLTNANYFVIWDKTNTSLLIKSSNKTSKLKIEVYDDICIVNSVLFAKSGSELWKLNLETDSTFSKTALDVSSSTIHSSGNCLYAIYGAKISVYNADLQLQSETNDLNLSNTTISFCNEKIFSITFQNSSGIPKFVLNCFDSSKNFEKQEILSFTEFHTHLAVGEKIYIFDSNSNKNTTSIKIFDIVGNEFSNLNLDFSVSEVNAFNNELFVFNNEKTQIVKFETTQNSIEKKHTISQSGQDDFHFSNPKDTLQTSNSTIIADTDNNRIELISNQNKQYYEIESPNSLASSSNNVFVASKNKIMKFENQSFEEFASIEQTETILSIDANSNMFALTENALFKYDSNSKSLVKFSDTPHAIQLAVSKSGTNIYVLTKNFLLVFDDEGNLIENLKFQFEENQFTAIEIDFIGNVYLSNKNGKIAKYKRNFNNFQFEKEIQLSSNIYQLGTINSIEILNENTMRFTSSNSFVAKTTSLSFETEQNFVSGIKPDLSIAKSKPAKILENTTFVYDLKNYDSSLKINKNEIVMIFENASPDSNFVYAIFGNHLGFISSTAFSFVEENTPKEKLVEILHDNTKLYSYPLATSTTPHIILKKGTIIELVSDVGNFASPTKWLKAKINQSYVYLLCTDVTSINNASMIEGKTVYGKAKASKIGEKINIFALPSTETTVLTSIADGTEIIILDDTTYDGFVKIKCGEITGFVLSEHVTKNALTTAQIIAIAVFSSVAGISIIIFVLLGMYRKKIQNNF